MKRHGVHICSFTSTDELKGKTLTYDNMKALVLKAGRFSVFEATKTQKHARLFSLLNKDSELIIDYKSEPFPWILVRKKEK